jgi:hypothetical protein
MGLDVYVGAFTRYYAGDWETVVQQMARETGIEMQMIRPEPAPDVITDPDIIRPAVIAWREGLSEGLGSNLDGPLDWDESAKAPYFTDKPAWDCFSSLLLWAAYAEHPELTCPDEPVEDYTTDPAYQASNDPDAACAFSQLLRGVKIWLPHDFEFIFNTTDLTGQELPFGSSVDLCRQLEELNRRTWNASDETLAEWQREGAASDAPLETQARFAFAVMTDLARKAVEHRLIMKLDY